MTTFLTGGTNPAWCSVPPTDEMLDAPGHASSLDSTGMFSPGAERHAERHQKKSALTIDDRPFDRLSGVEFVETFGSERRALDGPGALGGLYSEPVPAPADVNTQQKAPSPALSPESSLTQLDDAWRAGVMALLGNGWVCPTQLDFLEEEDDEEGEDEDEDDEDDEEEGEEDDTDEVAFEAEASYVWEGAWTASAAVHKAEGGKAGGEVTEFRVRLGIPWRLAAALRRQIPRQDAPVEEGHLRKHLPSVMEFAHDFFAGDFDAGHGGGAHTEQIAPGRKRTELRFANKQGSVRLVVEFTPEVVDEEGQSGWHFHSWCER